MTGTGLILEGGGMRGAYTAGVLDFFQDKGIEFPFVSATSSSALIGSYYVAKQKGANIEILQNILSNREAISFKRLLRQKELFEMDYIFHTIPTRLVPLNFETFAQAQAKYVIGTTDIYTGEPVYFDHYPRKDDLLSLIRASSSLPILASVVNYDGKQLMDGGIADPIPIRPSIACGNQKHVVILTRNRGYVKRKTRLNWLFKKVFREYPAFQKVLKQRHILYNQTLSQIYELEKRKQVFILMPEAPIESTRTERNGKKLHALYVQGYREAEKQEAALRRFLSHVHETRETVEPKPFIPVV